MEELKNDMIQDLQMFTGKVIFFRHSYGFIAREGLPDLFVHYSDLAMEGFKTLKKDQEVQFNIGKNHQNIDKAINVTLLKQI